MTVAQRIAAYFEKYDEVGEGPGSPGVARRIAEYWDLNYNSVRRELAEKFNTPADDAPAPELDLAAIKRDYSNWVGRGQTVKTLAKKYGTTQKAMKDLIKEQGWTHASSPLAPGLTEEEALKELAEMEEVAIYEEHERRRLRAVEVKAQKYDLLLAREYNPVIEWLENFHGPMPEPAARTLSEPAPGDHRRALVLHPTDLHIGKRGFKVGTGDLLQAVGDSIEKIVSQAERIGFDRIVTTIGNDWFNADTPSGATTRGTPQSLDLSPFQMLRAGYDLAYHYIDALRSIGVPVDVMVVRGNHDNFAMDGLGNGLVYHYAKVAGVNVHHVEQDRQYLAYGRNLLGFCHGDGAKPEKLTRNMPDEAPALWATCPFRYWVVGHLHHIKHQKDMEVDSHGVHILQGPAPSVTDRWHDIEGWTLAQNAMVGYLFHFEDGHEARLLANIRYKK